jgi:hypothetical protein
MQVKLRKFFRRYTLAAPIAGSALLVIGGATAFWWLTRQTFTPGTLPVGANVIPQDALVVVTLNTDEQQWRQLRQFGTPKSQAAFDQVLVQWRDQIFAGNGIDYRRDIKPWVGEAVTIAQLSPQAELSGSDATVVPSALSPQPMLAILPIADPLKAREIMSNPQAGSGDGAGRKWSERTYRDIKIRESQPLQPQQPSLQLAVIENRFLLVTNSARSMDSVIATYRDGKSLAQTPGYAQALGQIQQPTRPFMTLYRNIPASITSAAANFDKPLSKSNQDWVQQSQGWATVANLQSEGIEFRNVAWLKPDSKRKIESKNNAKTMTDRMPAETLTMFSGSDFKQFWQDYQRDYVTYPMQPINPAIFNRSIQESLGLNWNDDLLNWMGGEFVLGVVPMPGNDAVKIPIGIVAMVQTNDRAQAEIGLKKLDAAMASRQKYKVENGKFNNEEVTNWSDPNTGTTITRGWMNNNVAFFALGAPVTGTFFPQPREPLGKDSSFRQVTVQNEKQTANGYFLINFERIFSLSKLPPLLTWMEPYRDWLEGVRTIGLTAVNTSDRSTRYDAIVLLKKGNTPGLLPAVGSTLAPKPTPSPKPTPKSN